MNNLNLSTGYGLAGYNLVSALKRLGHSVPFQDATADVEISFTMPDSVEWSNPDAYHILYFPWESDEIPEDWKHNMREADELWVTSPYVKKIVEKNGFTVKRVLEHGVVHATPPRLRGGESVVKFLLVGGEAPRKNSQMTWKAFNTAFGNLESVHLTVKANTYSGDRIYDSRGNIVGLPYSTFNNMSLITKELEPEEMDALYNDADVLVYPTYGEGFGLIPLQGLASGMPVICTGEWASYAGFLDEKLVVESRWGPSFIQNMHPGNWPIPQFDSLVQCFKNAYENIDELSEQHYKQAQTVLDYYNWDQLVETAFMDIVTGLSVTEM